jgi:hypothetical protein
MRFMNTYDIEDAAQRFANHPILGPATKTLENLCEWANHNSDGWAYWPKPARAAAKLMEMIERDGTWQWRNSYREDVTVAEYRKALAPIKAFRTKQGADCDFKIEEII